MEAGPWIRLVREVAVVDGRAALGRDGIHPIAVVRWKGQLYAFRNRCPHAGGPLSAGDVRGGEVTCPRHGWAFRLVDGACPLHPLYSLRRYEVRVTEGWVEGRALDPPMDGPG